MRLTFADLWENLQKAKVVDPGGEGSDSSKAKEVITKGLNPSLLKSKNFWEIFMDLCNNQGPGLAELLDIEESKMVNWSKNIDSMLRQVEEEETQEPDKKRANVITTGNEPLASDSEAPEKGDAYKLTQSFGS